MVKKKDTITERDVLRAIAEAVDDLRDHVVANEETQRFILASLPDEEFFAAVATNYPGALVFAFMEVRLTEMAKIAGNPILATIIRKRLNSLRENGDYADIAWRKFIEDAYEEAGDFTRAGLTEDDADAFTTDD